MATGKNLRSTNQVELSAGFPEWGDNLREGRPWTEPLAWLLPQCPEPLLPLVPQFPLAKPLAQSLALFSFLLTEPFSFYFFVKLLFQKNMLPSKTHFSCKLSTVVPELESHSLKINRSCILLHRKNRTLEHWSLKDNMDSKAGARSWHKISKGDSEYLAPDPVLLLPAGWPWTSQFTPQSFSFLKEHHRYHCYDCTFQAWRPSCANSVLSSVPTLPYSSL